MKYWSLLLVFLMGCAHFHPELQGYNFTVEEPPETVEEAIRQADPLVDETPILDLPYAEPTPLRLSQPAPYAGILFSEYDTARYRLLDESGETWRLRAVTAEWQLARTQYRDAELIEALEDRIRFTEAQSRRRKRLIWISVGSGVVLGVGTTLMVNGLLR